MKSLSNRIPTPAALIALGLLFFLGLLGFRGVDRAGLELLDRVREANRHLMEGASSDVFASPHPFVDVLGIPLAALGHHELLAQGVLAALAVSLSLPPLWSLARSVSGRLGAVFAVGFFAGMPAVASAATTVGESAVVLLMWCWIMRLAVRTRHTRLSTAFFAVLAVALTLSWAPILLWLGGWLVVYIVARGLSHPHKRLDLEGLIDPTTIPVALIIAPLVAVIVPTLLFMATGTDPGAGWGRFMEHALFGDWPTIEYGGQTFDERRPSLLIGVSWLAFEAPPVVLVSAIAALILPATEHFGLFARRPGPTRGFEFPRAFCVATLVLLLALPWALGTRSIGGVPTLLLAAPILAVMAGALAATIVREVIDYAEAHQVSARTRRITLGVLSALFLVPGLYATAMAHPYEGSYYNLFADSASGAVKAGHPAIRDGALPVAVARDAAELAGERPLYTDRWREHFEAYLHADQLSLTDLAQSPAEAEARFYARGDEPDDDAARQFSWALEDVKLYYLDVHSSD